MNKVQHFGPLLAVMLLLIVACHKDGELLTAPQITETKVRVFSPSQDSRFMAFIDDNKIGDTILVGGVATRTISKTEGAQHFVLKNVTTNETVLDTMLVLSKPSCTLSIVQYDATAGIKPLLYVGGGASAEIAQDSAKFSFYLGDTAIHSPVDIYMYQTDNTLFTVNMEPVHIFRNVQNYSATDFVTVDMSSANVGYVMEIRDSGTGELLESITNGAVTPDNPYSGILTLPCLTPGNGVPTNVHSIFVLQGFSGYYLAQCSIFF